MDRQEYVSEELIHFVGRGKPVNEQFDLLVKIIKSGLLTPSPGVPVEQFGVLADLHNTNLSDDDFIKHKVVCFCDIPKKHLAIHMAKYSRFGLSFNRGHLIGHGANPVFYIAKNTPVAMDQIFPIQHQLERLKGVIDTGKYFSMDQALLLIIIAISIWACCFVYFL